MGPADVIREAMGKALVDEDGESVRLELLPPLSDSEIASFAERLPCPLPPEIRELLSVCSGFEGSAADVVDFTGVRCLFDYEAVFPHGLPIAADGFGNFWVVDLQPASQDWGPIYFARHDTPVILYQSPNLAHFLVELLKLSEPPHRSLVDDVHEDRLFQVWRNNPGVRPREECLASDDLELRGFAKELDPWFEIVDLREPRPGVGFSWGRYGPNTVVRRHGTLPIFAYQEPQGLLKRLLGGSAPRRPGPGAMPLSDRLAVAAVAAAVALPGAGIALIVMLLSRVPAGYVAMLVWPAFLVLGSIWTYEIVSRIMRGKVDRHHFSATAVAIGTMAGILAGLFLMMMGVTQALLALPAGGLVGAFLGTYVPAKAPDPSHGGSR